MNHQILLNLKGEADHVSEFCFKSYFFVYEGSEVSQSFLCVSEDKTQGYSSLCLDPYFGFFWKKNKSESVMNKPNLHSQNHNKKKTNKNKKEEKN